MKGMRKQLSRSAETFRSVAANPNLRRLELAWAGSTIGHWGYMVAVSVYAYRAGGASAVGVVYAIRMAPSALVSPFTSVLADRFRREWVMLASDLARAGAIGLAAAGVFLDARPELIYGLAVVAALVATPFRPAQAAVSPSLARTPDELTAANVVASTIESVGFFVGPALAGLLLAVASTGTVFLVTALLFLWSAFFVARIRVDSAARERARAEGSTIVAEVLAGFRTVAASSHLRVLLGLLAAQTLVAGGLSVLVVVMAIELLDLGNAGVGFLDSAFGVGALIGAFGSLALVGLRRLSPPFVLGCVLWGAPLALIGIWPNTALAVVLLGSIGVGNTLVDVAGFTLVQRAVPDEVLARVFGVMQMLWLGAMGIGAIVTAPLVEGLGSRAALILVGAFLPTLALLLARRLVTIDAAAEAPDLDQLALLRSIPIFAPLPGTPLEHLAARIVPVQVSAGTEVVREGDRGDRFYMVVDGELNVTADGRRLTTLGPGGFFGEIALVRDVPRTASVVAQTDSTLYALEREDFLAALTSHAPSAATADAVVSGRLSRTVPPGQHAPPVGT